MRIALCLSGYFGTLSTNDFTTAYAGYEYLREHVLCHDNVDVFVHCWQPEFADTIDEMYHPVKTHIESQIDFKRLYPQIDQNYIDAGFHRGASIFNNATAERILSFYYSRCMAIHMALTHDPLPYWIIATRFDIGHRGGTQVNQLHFNPTLPNNSFYSAHWDQMNHGYGDMWWYGSPIIAGIYHGIFNSACLDFQPESSYEQWVTTGIPDSQYYNHKDFHDHRQFSNEILKPESQRCKELMYFPRWRMTDSHLHHKWFCMQRGLYKSTVWL